MASSDKHSLPPLPSQVAATQLADAHAPGGTAMPTGTATALVAAAGAALARLAELLRSSGPIASPELLAPVHAGDRQHRSLQQSNSRCGKQTAGPKL